MRHFSMCPIRSPGPTIAKRTPERIGQTTQMSRKSFTKKMRLIWLDRDRITLDSQPIYHLRDSESAPVQKS
jgi:hypothetical protein